MGDKCENICLRSLRQIFQYHFYNSNPTFGELREFNRCMDHNDVTGLIYYNRLGRRNEIYSPIQRRNFLINNNDNQNRNSLDNENSSSSAEAVEIYSNVLNQFTRRRNT